MYHRASARLSCNPMRKLLLALSSPCHCGCGMLYRQPIYQGNLLEKTNVDQLQAGMDKRQVMALLGTPSIADPFHHERWDYTATQRTDRIGTTEIKNLTLWFEGDALAKLGRRILPRAGRSELAKEMRDQFGRTCRRTRRRSGSSAAAKRARLLRAARRVAGARPSGPPCSGRSNSIRSPSRSTACRRRRARRCSAQAVDPRAASRRREARRFQRLRHRRASATSSCHDSKRRGHASTISTRTRLLRAAVGDAHEVVDHAVGQALEAQRERRPQQLVASARSRASG